MAGKFLIVNNGLTESRGQLAPLEVARAASCRGFDVLMAVHARRDPTAFSAELPTVPLFRVDWGGDLVAEKRPSVVPLRGELVPLFRTPLESLLVGKVNLREWLEARFVPAAERSGLTARFTQAARRILPLLAGLLRVQMPWRKGGSALPTDAERLLRHALELVRPTHNEFTHYQMFGADLERLLVLSGATAGDHVYLPAAHGRDAAAITALVRRVGASRLPTFHLVFRHAVLSATELEREPCPQKAFSTRIHRAYFDACRAHPESSTVRFYADTSELAATYAELAGFHFGVLSTECQTPQNLLDRLLRACEPQLASMKVKRVPAV